MINKYSGIVAVVVSVVALVLALGASGAAGPQGPAGPVGGPAGPDHYDTEYFYKNVVVGNGSVATTSTAATYVITTREMDVDTPYVSWLPNVNTTLTTMASTSAPFSGLKTGQSFEQIWYNASTTAGATITFAAGTGVDLQEDEGGTVVVNGLETARITYIKKADTDTLRANRRQSLKSKLINLGFTSEEIDILRKLD